MDPDKQQRIDDQQRQADSAADLVRAKLDKIYGAEPNAKEELAEVKAIPDNSLSKHQHYMKDLSSSGRSLAEIQTAWHEYYANLDDTGKHEVWQEFYAQHEKAKQAPVAPKEPEPAPAPIISNNTAALAKKRRTRSHAKRTQIPKVPANLQTAKDVKQEILSQVQTRAATTGRNPHVRALAFGLSMGALTIFIMMFGFFNERFIHPFIRPNSNVSATPIIVDPGNNSPVGPESKIIIPKISVEAPVVYDVPSIAEDDVQKGLENGVVHYITTPNPGEKGNSVIFGHSSSNILNKGKYKFAFLLLKSLENDDTFIVQKDGKRFVYKVYNKYVTSPTDLSVLNATDKPAIMTLITCDPPGTSTNRLIIQAEQIFPDPAANTESSATQVVAQAPEQLPSNSVTMWRRILNWF